MNPANVYDYQRISEHTGVPAATLRVWYHRGKLPEPDFQLGRSPGWLPGTIHAWWASRDDG